MAPATETPATEAIEVEEIFADLLEQSMAGADGFEGRVVTGIVLALDSDAALIDVGLKSEGRISLKEFSAPGLPHELKVGDKVEVFVERSNLEQPSGFPASNRGNGPCQAPNVCGVDLDLVSLHADSADYT